MDYGDGKLQGTYQFNTQYRKKEICKHVTKAKDACSSHAFRAASAPTRRRTSAPSPTRRRRAPSPTRRRRAPSPRPTPSGSYAAGNFNTVNCKHLGMKEITGHWDCKQAQKSLQSAGFKLASPSKKSVGNELKGCWANKKNKITFNTHKTGLTKGSSWQRPICKR